MWRRWVTGLFLLAGFLDLIVSTPPLARSAPAESNGSGGGSGGGVAMGTCQQVWKAGYYVGASVGDWDSHTGDMEKSEQLLHVLEIAGFLEAAGSQGFPWKVKTSLADSM